MTLVWHELLMDDDPPDYPEENRTLIFHVYEIGRTFCGYYFDGCFSLHMLSECDHCFQFLEPEGLRVAWAYLEIPEGLFPRFDAIEQEIHQFAEDWMADSIDRHQPYAKK